MRSGSTGGGEASLPPVSGVVLAGGRSSRMGRTKSLVEVGGVPMIVRVGNALGGIVADLVVVADDHRRAGGLPARIARDAVVDAGPVAGLAAGLRAAEHELCVVVACDLPFLQPRLLRYLVDLAASDGADATVPRSGGRPQPLHAVYRRSCLPAVEDALDRSALQMSALLDRLHTRYVEPEAWMPFDPLGISLRNVNTPQELEEAERTLP